MVVATIAEDDVGFLARTADLARDGPRVQVFKQRDELGDVVAVAARERDGERDAGRIDQEVVL